MTTDAYDVMDLKALRCFWAMARHASMTQAGIELGISEAAVSQRIKSLEKYLNAKLYESRGGRVRLTEAGERTLEMANTTFERLEHFQDNVVRSDESARITLCTTDSPLRYMLPPALLQFTAAHPHATLRLQARSVERSVALVRSNEADIGIVPAQTLPDELLFEPIATYAGLVIFPRGHALARQGRVDFQSLLSAQTMRRFPLIASETQVKTQFLKRIFDRLELPLNIGMEVSTVDTLKHYVALGLGVATLSSLCLTDADYAYLDVIEAPAELDAHTEYGLITRRDKHRSGPLETLIALIKQSGSTRAPLRSRPS